MLHLQIQFSHQTLEASSPLVALNPEFSELKLTAWLVSTSENQILYEHSIFREKLVFTLPSPLIKDSSISSELLAFIFDDLRLVDRNTTREKLKIDSSSGFKERSETRDRLSFTSFSALKDLNTSQDSLAVLHTSIFKDANKNYDAQHINSEASFKDAATTRDDLKINSLFDFADSSTSNEALQLLLNVYSDDLNQSRDKVQYKTTTSKGDRTYSQDSIAVIRHNTYAESYFGEIYTSDPDFQRYLHSIVTDRSNSHDSILSGITGNYAPDYMSLITPLILTLNLKDET